MSYLIIFIVPINAFAVNNVLRINLGSRYMQIQSQKGWIHVDYKNDEIIICYSYNSKPDTIIKIEQKEAKIISKNYIFDIQNKLSEDFHVYYINGKLNVLYLGIQIFPKKA